MTRDFILESHHLRKEFGGLVAVANVSLQVERHTIHSIIGPNGAGKTTLFNLLSGRYSLTSGRVSFKGQDITDAPFHRRAHLGMARSYQITNIFPNLTVLENVRLAVQALSPARFNFFRSASSYKGFIDKAIHILEQVGLGDVVEQPANALPHGGKRKLELAILLASDAELLLLDEPTAGMASEQVPELIKTIETVRQLGDKTIVLVEHNMNLVMNISNKITVMNYGEVLAEGKPADIANNVDVQNVYLGGLYREVMKDVQ